MALVRVSAEEAGGLIGRGRDMLMVKVRRNILSMVESGQRW